MWVKFLMVVEQNYKGGTGGGYVSPKWRLLKTEYTSHCLIVGNRPQEIIIWAGWCGCEVWVI